MKGQSDACLYCHAPHSGVGTPNGALWSQTLSMQTYTAYSSTTLKNAPLQPSLGGSSSLCLSCHDGTVAVGQTQPYGPYTMTGSMNPADMFGAGLQGSHPFSLKLPLVDAPDLQPALTSDSYDSRSDQGCAIDQRQRGVHQLPFAARAVHRSHVAELPGA